MNRVLLSGTIHEAPVRSMAKTADLAIWKFKVQIDEPGFKGGIKTHHVPVTMFGDRVEDVLHSLRVGDRVELDGKLTSRTQEKAGSKFVSIDVQGSQVIKVAPAQHRETSVPRERQPGDDDDDLAF